MLDAVSAHASHALGLLDSLETLTSTQRLLLLLERFDLSVKDVNPSSALLYGADACIDPMSRTVRIRRDIDSRYRREILAHEIAHVILGHDTIGETVQRRETISAYGRNERVERMADNLAAMLLISDFELNHARRCNTSFTDAAAYLDVSIDTLIRRLTQHKSPVAVMARSRYALLQHQLQAVDFVGDICIEGGVATGKTEVLLERLIRLADRHDTGHSRILFVTYLRKHMVYLFERLTNVAPLLAERVNFTTFHDYAADIILRNYAKAGWTSMPTVVGQGEVEVLLIQMFPDTIAKELQQKVAEFTQSLRYESASAEDWQVALSEQLYQLHYIHNGSLGKIASKLMALDSVSTDEAERWDAIFVDNYEQLTYDELTVLRLAARRAPLGISIASGFSTLPYAYRGVSDESAARWRRDCDFQVFDFSIKSRIRSLPKQTTLSPRNPISQVLRTVRLIAEKCAPDEKIVVASHHNAILNRCRAAIARELPELISDSIGSQETCDRLYTLIDNGAAIDTFLDAWWDSYRNVTDSDAELLQEVLANVQTYAAHRSRSQAVGLSVVTMRTYMESIRPHHQYKDIGITERLSFQTLHSLSGGEVEHLVILLDDLSDRANLDQTRLVLLDNAMARATHTLTLIAGNVCA